MPEWQITPSEYFKRLNLDINQFEKQLNLPDVEDITKIIPLRDIHEIISLIPMSFDLLRYLLRRIPTLDGRHPFTNTSITMTRMDPRSLKIGQKFVYRENYLGLLEEVPDIFGSFAVTPGGLGDLGAYFVFGLNGNNETALACYMPPIIEKHGSDLIVMDGIHRDYIGKQTGLALTVILAENISLPFPCSPRDWSEIRVIPVSEKPKDINERYFDLHKELFRDLKYLGIDG